jgi:outer membrane receptor protein involved in Fe transport
MKNRKLCNLFKSTVLTSIGLSLALVPQISSAQSESDDQGFSALDEITVTARKREESLQDIPVAISVVNATQLAELNVLRQEDLAALVPGFHYNQGVGIAEDRTAALPSIRGIGSTELATNRSKVATLIDGMPILGSVGAINIGGATQVEVYRGPQSAAFGRSTFAGAINYVTRDPGDEIAGTVGMNWSDDGTRIVNGFVGGPITDTLGFQVGVSIEDSESPDPKLYSYTDGVEATAETGENISARLVFTPNDKFKAKFSYARDTTDDGPRSDFYASAESSHKCYESHNTFNVRNNVGPPNNLGIDGVFECELKVHPDTVLEQLNDYRRYFDNNPDVLTSIADDLRAQGAMDGYLGLSVEEQALIIYEGYSVKHGLSGSESERDRFTAQFDYELDNGSGFQLSLMTSDEDIFRGYSRVAEQEVQSLSWNPMGGYYDNYALSVNAMGMLAQNGRRVPDNGPTTIEENYMEVRWVSPAEDRLRYVVGASYYDYEYVFIDYGAPGYNNLLSGTADLFAQLIDPDELTDSGGVVAPTSIQSEVTTNTAIYFNVGYDFTETLTGSIEGRYASDDVGAVLPLAGLEESVTTDGFTPRIALNWTPNDTTTYYIQYSQGVNPAGINAAMLDPLLRNTLDNGVAVDDTIYGGSIDQQIVSVNYDSDRYVSFDEEELTNYEIGFKGTALDGRFSYTGAFYYMEWDSALENIALDWDYTYADDDLAGTLVTDTDPTGPAGVYYVPETQSTSVNQIYTNTGTSDTLGMEFQVNYQFNDSWSVSANAALMKREFTNFCSEDDFLGFPNEIGVYAELEEGVSSGGNPCWVLDGLEVADQPSFNMTVIPRYRTQFGNDIRFTASATLRHVTDYYDEYSNTRKKPAINRVNLNLGLSKGPWSAILYINNVFDDEKMTPRNATSVARFNQLNAPAEIPVEYQYDAAGGPWGSFRMEPNFGRSYGLRMNYDF